ncbi:MAG: hypothetical protein ACK5LT_08645 [Lachnospirales bacterium]
MATNFTYVKKGYDPDEVDRYIEKLEEVIKSYKDKDLAIKNAIVSAQIAADNIVKNAELQAISYKCKAVEQLKSIQGALDEQRKKVGEFKNDYNFMIKKYIVDFEGSEISSVENKINSIDLEIEKIQERLTGGKLSSVESLSDTKVVHKIDEIDKADKVDKTK